MNTSLEVAQEFLDLADKEGRTLSNLQLQKLVFFAHGLYLALDEEGKDLVNTQPMAWNFGPVFKDLYEKLQEFGSGAVTKSLARSGALEADHKAMLAVKLTWKAYKDYTPGQLINISHASGSPWDKSFNIEGRKYDFIPREDIRRYYLKRVQKQASSATA